MHCLMASCALCSPLTGRSSAKLRRSPFTEYCRAGNVTFLPPSRRSHTAKPISFIPLSGPASASKTTSASASFPTGEPCSLGMIFTDTSSPLDLDMVVLQDCRGPETDGSGWFARVLRTPANRGETHGPEGECVVTGFVINTTSRDNSQVRKMISRKLRYKLTHESTRASLRSGDRQEA